MPGEKTNIDDVQFHRIARALADPQRFAILEMLASADEVACKVLVRKCAVTQATISHHLKELQFAGLVDGRREGRCFHFKLKRGVMRAYHRMLRERLAGPARRN
jgi:ArsR family transcriptional regulator